MFICLVFCTLDPRIDNRCKESPAIGQHSYRAAPMFLFQMVGPIGVVVMTPDLANQDT